MTLENRQFTRYSASEKAVLVSGGAKASLCIITNVSKGGLHLSVVGAPAPAASGRIIIDMNRTRVPCKIVNVREAGLHCRFEESVAAGYQPVAPAVVRSVLSDIPSLRFTPGLSLIYAQGFFSGMSQLDPPADLDLVIATICPHEDGDERQSWALGFQDAVFRSLKHKNLP
jgi:hypothetical protein